MKVIVVFPARNEAKTIAKCIEVAKQSKFKPEILVIDGYSMDKTKEEAESVGATVIQQSTGIFPAKGRAIKDGIREALSRQADIIVFLDADIVNLTPEWVDLLVKPVITPVVKKKCDMARGYYRRAEYDGAVTKLVAKPLAAVFFPEIAIFNQPLSGEICATSELFQTVIAAGDCPDGWGIDIWLLIETAIRDYKIKEVYMGSKVHTSRQDYFQDVAKLAKMAEEVALTTFKEAIKYKRIANIERCSL